MSMYVPESMEEVAMKVAQYQVHGQQVTPEQVIHDAVRDTLQALLDDALEGHYDDVHWVDDQLKVTDSMGADVALVSPEHTDFVADFKQDPSAVKDYLADQVAKMVGGR